MSQRVHTNEILEGLMALIETNLKTTLSLVGIYRGNLAWLPPQDLSDLVNGVWLTVGAVKFEEVSMPRGLQVTYPIRIVLVRRIDATTNPLEVKIDDVNQIIEMIYDNVLPSFSLTDATILWMLPRTAEYEPAEDAYVTTLSADLMAVSFEIELAVRTRI